MKQIRTFAIILVCMLSFLGCNKQDAAKGNSQNKKSDTENISSDASKKNKDIKGFIKYYGDVDLKKAYSKEEIRRNIESIILQSKEDSYMYEIAHLSKVEYYIPVVVCDIVADFDEKDKYILLANIYDTSYTLNEGVVYDESGGISPTEIVFDKDEAGFVFSKVNYPLDGAGFEESVSKMARGNLSWRKSMMDSQSSNYSFSYNKEMKKLDEVIKSNNIQGYNHDMDKLAESKGYLCGYEVGLRIDNYDRRPGNICLVKKDDYDAFLKRLKNGENYTYTDAIYYNKDTGICVKGLFDNFDYERLVKQNKDSLGAIK